MPPRDQVPVARGLRLRSTTGACAIALVVASGPMMAGCSTASTGATTASSTVGNSAASTRGSAASVAPGSSASAGTPSATVTPSATGTPSAAGTATPIGSGTASDAPDNYTGHLTTVTIPGPTSHYSDQVVVWTPPSYDSGTGTHPAVMGLHGWPGSPKMVYNNIQLLAGAQAEVDQKAMAAPVLVIPQWGRVDTECTNSDAAHQVETWLSVDVPAWIEAHYRVRAGAQNWATLGFSAGAYCAAMLSMRHPDVFGAGVSLSGYSQVWFEPPFQPFTVSSPQGQAYDLALIARRQRPDVALYVLSDPSDSRSYPSTRRLLDAVQSPTRVTTVLASGGHSVKLWVPQTRDSLAWLGRTLKGFAPN